MPETSPLILSAPIVALRPTQMTLGHREVMLKRRAWRRRSIKAREAYLDSHPVPVVIGPKGRYWMVDKHHLARALWEEGVKTVLVRVVGGLGDLPVRLFKPFLMSRHWLYPIDAKGRRLSISRLPKRIDQLADDPYRSLAGALRRAGGFTKVKAPFAEFRWAAFLRLHIGRAVVEENFEVALSRALALAHDGVVVDLTGWCKTSVSERKRA